MKIVMTPKEVDLLSSFLKCTENYFEYGMGGSTLLASSLVSESITSIESDGAWVEKVRREVDGAKISITLNHVNIGPTGGWGTPVNRANEELFPNYPRAIAKTDNGKIDFCLVDGRFRVACAAQAFLTLRSDSIVAIHDYNNRPQYHVVENFARKLASCDTLALFVRRPDAARAKIQSIFDQYQTNWE